jgi:hypothetical protein
MRRALLAAAALGALAAGSTHSAVHDVPSVHATIQAAIDAAASSDTVLVAPGTYLESGIFLSGKNIVLGSWFLTTGDPAHVPATVIDGGGSTILEISGTVVDSTAIVGLTFRNGEDGIFATSRFLIEHCRIEECTDGIDYESGSGGICRYNVFERCTDDGIDLDDDVDILIEYNEVVDNEDDGIEIRLQDYTGPTLSYVIRWNTFRGNLEDGIQIIDYDGYSDRNLVIERNLFVNNAMAGLGCMSGGNTNEDYEGASVLEPILLANNVFDGHNHGITGGDSLTAVNNIVINSTVLGMKNVDGGSTVSHTCAWMNGTNFLACNLDSASVIVADPLLKPAYTLQWGSPCIDAGATGCLDPDATPCDLGVFFMDQNSNDAPEIPRSRRSLLRPATPNPFTSEMRASFELRAPSTVTLAIYDLRGRIVRTLVNGERRDSGLHTPVWDGRTGRGEGAASGVYFLQLTAGATQETRRIVLVR